MESRWQNRRKQSPCLLTTRAATRHWPGTLDTWGDGRNPHVNQWDMRGWEEKKQKWTGPGPLRSGGGRWEVPAIGVAHGPQGGQWGQGKDLHRVGGWEGNLASIPRLLGPHGAHWGPSLNRCSPRPSPVVLSLNPSLPPRTFLAALVLNLGPHPTKDSLPTPIAKAFSFGVFLFLIFIVVVVVVFHLIVVVSFLFLFFSKECIFLFF